MLKLYRVIYMWRKIIRVFCILLWSRTEKLNYRNPCRNFDRGLVGPWKVCPISSRDIAWKTSQGPVGNVCFCRGGPTRLSSRGLVRSALSLPHLQKRTPLEPYWTSALYLRAYISRVAWPILFRYLTEKLINKKDFPHWEKKYRENSS